MNMKDYFVNWDAHLTTFWVPIILGLIFLSLAIQSLVKDRNVRVCILYVFLLLCCVCATLAAHLMMYVLTRVNASVLYTIDNGGVLVLSVLYSCFLFKEKLSLPQGIGIGLSMVSIIALSL